MDDDPAYLEVTRQFYFQLLDLVGKAHIGSGEYTWKDVNDDIKHSLILFEEKNDIYSEELPDQYNGKHGIFRNGNEETRLFKVRYNDYPWSDIVNEKDINENILKKHNVIRSKLYDSTSYNLKFDKELQIRAQKWAKKLASDCSLNYNSPQYDDKRMCNEYLGGSCEEKCGYSTTGKTIM